jgi:hypothetical protein
MENSIGVLITCLLLAQAQPMAGWRTVVNQQEDYRVSFPGSWTVWDSGPDGAISATTYPKNRAPGGGLVPPGEAAITIFPHKGESTTMEEWIGEIMKDLEEVRRKRVSLGPDSRDINSYIEVESRDDVAPGVYERTVTDYFYLRGRLFGARLERREGRDRDYQSVLDQVVRSIAVTDQPSQKR